MPTCLWKVWRCSTGAYYHAYAYAYAYTHSYTHSSAAHKLNPSSLKLICSSTTSFRHAYSINEWAMRKRNNMCRLGLWKLLLRVLLLR